MDKIISIGCDPGTNNYGYSILSYDGSKIKITTCGILHAVINNLTNKEQKPPKSKRRKTKHVAGRPPFMSLLDIFYKDWKRVFKEVTPAIITAERFQSRGFGGPTIEHVGMMNGVLATLAYQKNVPINLIMAASWKHHVNKYSDLEEIYRLLSIPPHLVDSAYIGLCGLISITDLEWSKQTINMVYKQLQRFEFDTKGGTA